MTKIKMKTKMTIAAL